jgi:transposase
MSYSEKSLQEIFDSLCQIPDFARLISFRRFEEYLKDDLGICFARLKTIKSNVDAPASKEMRRTLSLMVMKLMAEGHLVLFFDESLISEGTFRTKVWKLRKTKHIMLDRTNIAGTINILLLASVDRVWNFWLTKKMNSSVVISFLEESARAIRREQGNLPIFLFLDNCPSHRTADIRIFAEKAKMILIYNVVYSSKINPIEYLFEVIKRKFRNRICKGYRENLQKSLLEFILQLKPINLRISFKRAFKEMKNCIDYRNMWINI